MASRLISEQRARTFLVQATPPDSGQHTCTRVINRSGQAFFPPLDKRGHLVGVSVLFMSMGEKSEAASVAGARSVSCLSTLSNPLCARGSREAAALSLQWLEGEKRKKRNLHLCLKLRSGCLWENFETVVGLIRHSWVDAFRPKKFFLFSVSIILKFFTK